MLKDAREPGALGEALVAVQECCLSITLNVDWALQGQLVLIISSFGTGGGGCQWAGEGHRYGSVPRFDQWNDESTEGD